MLQNKAYMVLTGNTNCASFPPPPKRKKKERETGLCSTSGNWFIYNIS